MATTTTSSDTPAVTRVTKAMERQSAPERAAALLITLAYRILSDPPLPRSEFGDVIADVRALMYPEPR